MVNGKLQMNKLVSIIVTCYNHENYIQQCLESIFQQTYPSIELIVFNDGSTDKSEDIIKEVLTKAPFERIDFFSHENHGLVATRNKALPKIKGDYFLFVDSDNFLEPNYIEEMLKTAEKKGLDIVYTKLINPDNGALVLEAQDFNLGHYYIENFIDSCSLVRTSIIGDVKYDMNLNYKKLEDYDFFFNLIVNKEAKAGPCHSTHLNYRVIENSMSARNDLKYYYQVYAYILGKFFLDNPNLAKVALQENFERLFQLSSIEEQYFNQSITIYYSFDETPIFNHENILTFKLKNRDTLDFEIPDKVTFIRIDPSEIPSFFKELNLMEKRFRTSFEPININGLAIADGFVFPIFDPQLTFDVSNCQTKQFTLVYERHNIGNIYYEDYIAKTLSEEIVKKDAIIKELEEFRVKSTILEDQRQYYKRELEDMVIRYNSVIHSRRWTIPTKIINSIKAVIGKK